MFDQFKDLGKDITKSETPTTSTATVAPAPAEGTVDLFPAMADKRLMSINAIRTPVPTKVGTQISIFAPMTFDEALDIVECLRGRAATTITLDNMKKHDASRLVDFVAGASAALSGNFHKLSEQVYVFCPSNIKISVPTKVAPSSTSNPSLDFLYSSEKLTNKSWTSSGFTGN